MENMTTALKQATGQSIAAIANEVGLAQTTLNRQARTNDIPIKVLVDICRHYNLDLLDILERSGVITEEEVRQMQGTPGLDQYSECGALVNREVSGCPQPLIFQLSRLCLPQGASPS